MAPAKPVFQPKRSRHAPKSPPRTPRRDHAFPPATPFPDQPPATATDTTPVPASKCPLPATPSVRCIPITRTANTTLTTLTTPTQSASKLDYPFSLSKNAAVGSYNAAQRAAFLEGYRVAKAETQTTQTHPTAVSLSLPSSASPLPPLRSVPHPQKERPATSQDSSHDDERYVFPPLSHAPTASQAFPGAKPGNASIEDIAVPRNRPHPTPPPPPPPPPPLPPPALLPLPPPLSLSLSHPLPPPALLSHPLPPQPRLLREGESRDPRLRGKRRALGGHATPPKRARSDWAGSNAHGSGGRGRRDIDAEPAEPASGGWLSALADAARTKNASREDEDEEGEEGEEIEGEKADGEARQRENREDDEREEEEEEEDGEEGEHREHGDDDDDDNEGIIDERGDMEGGLSEGEVETNASPPGSAGANNRDAGGGIENGTGEGDSVRGGGGEVAENGAMEAEHANGASTPPAARTPNGTTCGHNTIAHRTALRNESDIDGDTTMDELCESTLQACIEQYGLIIVERDARTRAITWVCCKLCAVFGRRLGSTIKKLQCYTTPFRRWKFTRHLTNDHGTLWRDYMRCTAAEKGGYFRGFDVTPMELRRHVQAAKQRGGGLERRDRAHMSSQERVRVARAMVNRAHIRGTGMVRVGKRDWTGRRTWANEGMVVRWRRRKWDGGGRFRMRYVRGCVGEMDICDEVADLVRDGPYGRGDSGIVDTVEKDDEGIRAVSMVFRDAQPRTQGIMALLTRGLGMRACRDMVMLAGEIGGEAEEGEIEGEEDRREAEGGALGEVERIGKQGVAMGLELLKRVLERNWLNWAIALRCEEGFGGLRVCVSVRDEGGRRHWMHLMCVFAAEEVGERVVRVLEVVCGNWRVRLLGIQSGVGKGSVWKQVEEKILKTLKENGCRQDACVAEVEDDDMNATERPCFPWALADLPKHAFERLIRRNEAALRMALGDARLKALYQQQQFLLKARVKAEVMQTDGLHGVLLQRAWKMQGENVKECEVLANGLAVLWVRDGQRFAHMVVREEEEEEEEGGKGRKGAGVDEGLERVVWARQMVTLWRMCQPKSASASAIL